MVDISGYPSHIQEGITQIDLANNTLMRAKRGVEWLDRSGPGGPRGSWRLNMISIRDGIVISRVRMCRDDENVLALAFRDSGWHRSDGRVSWACVREKIPSLQSDFQAQHLGFLEQAHIAPNSTYISADIDSQFLDQAWATILKDWEWWPQMARPRKQVA